MSNEFKRNVNLSPEACKDVLVHILQSNDDLQKDGLKPIALEIMGEAGLGKTAIVYQAAESINKTVVKVSLSQMDELGD